MKKATKVEIFEVKSLNNGECFLENVGYIELDKFDPKKCFDICNWSCYSDTKPDNLFSNIETCGSNVVFYNSDQDKYYISLRFGWETVDTFEEVKDHFDLSYNPNI